MHDVFDDLFHAFRRVFNHGNPGSAVGLPAVQVSFGARKALAAAVVEQNGVANRNVIESLGATSLLLFGAVNHDPR